jgi:hypothetical protein
MDPVDAPEETECPHEAQDLCDDQVVHREEESEVTDTNSPNIGELTTDIQKAPRKKPRSKAQMEAFEKARKALALKREKTKADKELSRKPRGRPKKAPKITPKVVFEAPDSTESEESEEEVVYVQRKKPRRRAKPKKQPRIVYVTDSSDEEVASEAEALKPSDHWINFV